MENQIPNDSTQHGSIANDAQKVTTEHTAPASAEGAAPAASNDDNASFTASDKLKIIHIICEIAFMGLIVFLGSQAVNYYYGHNLVKALDDVGSVTGLLGTLGLSEDLRDLDEVIDVIKALYRDGIIFCVVGLLLSGIGARLSRQKGD